MDAATGALLTAIGTLECLNGQLFPGLSGGLGPALAVLRNVWRAVPEQVCRPGHTGPVSYDV